MRHPNTQEDAVKNFDEMLAKDREFQVGGETFHWRDVRPEVLEAFEPAEVQGSVWKIYDDQILLFLAPDEHDRWRAVRAQDEKAVSIKQIQAILQWLVEEQTGLPTEPPAQSAPGRGATAATSKAA